MDAPHATPVPAPALVLLAAAASAICASEAAFGAAAPAGGALLVGAGVWLGVALWLGAWLWRGPGPGDGRRHARRLRVLGVAVVALCFALRVLAAAGVAAHERAAQTPISASRGHVWWAVVHGNVFRGRAVGEADVLLRTELRLVAERVPGVGWQARAGVGAIVFRAPPAAGHAAGGALPALGRGDGLLVRLEVAPLRPASAPWHVRAGAFAWERAARRQGLAPLRLWPLSAPVVVADSRAGSSGPTGHGRLQAFLQRGLWRAADRVRLCLGARLEALLPLEAAAVAKALALGDTTGLGPAQREAWSRAGIAHLLAISGLHVSLLVRGAQVSARWLCLRPGWAMARAGLLRLPCLACGVALGCSYAWVTGGAVSAVRAAIMTCLGAAGQAFGRGGGSAANALGCTGLLLLLYEPLLLFQAGFVLSFAAVLALLCAQKMLRGPPFLAEGPPLGWLEAAGPPAHVDGPAGICTGPAPVGIRALAPVHRLGPALAAACLASAVTAPWMAVWFGQVSWVAPVSNLFAIAWASWTATPLAILLILLLALAEGLACLLPTAWVAGCLGPPQWLLAQALAASLWPLGALAEQLAWPAWASAQVMPPTAAAALLLSVAVLLGVPRLLRLFAASWRWARGRPLPVAGGAALAAATAHLVLLGLLVARPFAWRAPWAPSAAGDLRALGLWHLDVGHGDATLVRLPSVAGDPPSWFLVDGGGTLTLAGVHGDPGRTRVAPALRALGVRRLTAVILTHPHPDHMGGLAYVLANWPTRFFWYNQDAAQSPFVRALAASVRRAGGQAGPPPAALTLAGVRLSFLLPLADQPASVNDRSVVLRIAFGHTCALLTGDIEAAAEQALLPGLAPCEVLKVAHHGSNTSTSTAFLRALRPRWAVISAGERNRFGFPHAGVLARLAQQGTATYDTGRHGVVRLQSDGVHWQLAAGAGPLTSAGAVRR